jgi:hypothetical protein
MLSFTIWVIIFTDIVQQKIYNKSFWLMDNDFNALDCFNILYDSKKKVDEDLELD